MYVIFSILSCLFHLLYTGTSRKYIRGPRGVGFLVLNKIKKTVPTNGNDRVCIGLDVFEPAMIDVKGSTLIEKKKNSSGGDSNSEISEDNFKRKYSYIMANDATRYEQYEHNYANIVGFSNAIKEILEIGIGPIAIKIQYLAQELRHLLQCKVYGGRITVHDTGTFQCGIVSFSIGSIDAKDVKRILKEEYNIFVHTSRASSSLAFFEAYKLPPSVVRVSLHYYNTVEEVKRLVECIYKIIEQDEKHTKAAM